MFRQSPTNTGYRGKVNPNHVWAIDFVRDKLSNARTYKTQTVRDAYIRQALDFLIQARIGSDDVLKARYRDLKRGSQYGVVHNNRAGADRH